MKAIFYPVFFTAFFILPTNTLKCQNCPSASDNLYSNKIDVVFCVPTDSVIRATDQNFKTEVKGFKIKGGTSSHFSDWDDSLKPGVIYFYAPIYKNASKQLDAGSILAVAYLKNPPQFFLKNNEFTPNSPYSIDFENAVAGTDSIEVQIVPTEFMGEWTSAIGFSSAAAYALVFENINQRRFSFVAPPVLSGNFLISTRFLTSKDPSYFTFPDTIRSSVPFAAGAKLELPKKFELRISAGRIQLKVEIPEVHKRKLIEFYISQDKTLSQNDILLGTNLNEEFGKIAPKEFLLDYSFRIPVALKNGQYYIIAKIKGDGYAASEQPISIRI